MHFARSDTYDAVCLLSCSPPRVAQRWPECCHVSDFFRSPVSDKLYCCNHYATCTTHIDSRRDKSQHDDAYALYYACTCYNSKMPLILFDSSLTTCRSHCIILSVFHMKAMDGLRPSLSNRNLQNLHTKPHYQKNITTTPRVRHHKVARPMPSSSC